MQGRWGAFGVGGCVEEAGISPSLDGDGCMAFVVSEGARDTWSAVVTESAAQGGHPDPCRGLPDGSRRRTVLDSAGQPNFGAESPFHLLAASTFEAQLNSLFPVEPVLASLAVRPDRLARRLEDGDIQVFFDPGRRRAGAVQRVRHALR